MRALGLDHLCGNHTEFTDVQLPATSSMPGKLLIADSKKDQAMERMKM